MQGYFLPVWPQTWEAIWQPVQSPDSEISTRLSELLSEFDSTEEFAADREVWCALYAEVAKALPGYDKPATEREFEDVGGHYVAKDVIDLSEIATNSELSLNHFRALIPSSFESEAKVVTFMESAYDVFFEFSDLLADRYRLLLCDFVRLHNLRYYVTDDCKIYPTLQGFFAELCIELEVISRKDSHLGSLYSEFFVAFREFKSDQSEGKIKTCFQKLINLIEAISLAHPDIEAKTLGEACSRLNTWPHKTIQNSISSIYGFTSDYPGLRHSGNPESKLRDLDARDLFSISLTLISYLPYLAHRDDWMDIYSGAHGG